MPSTRWRRWCGWPTAWGPCPPAPCAAGSGRRVGERRRDRAEAPVRPAAAPRLAVGRRGLRAPRGGAGGDRLLLGHGPSARGDRGVRAGPADGGPPPPGHLRRRRDRLERAGRPRRPADVAGDGDLHGALRDDRGPERARRVDDLVVPTPPLTRSPRPSSTSDFLVVPRRILVTAARLCG